MSLPERWMIATDGSTYASQAVDYAAKLYRQLDPKPEVLLLTVIPDPRQKKPDPVANERSKTVLREAKERFLREAGSADTVSTLVAIGEPREVIVDAARKNGIGHVIMGGADYQWRITDLLSGGVTNYILHHLNCVITMIK